MTVKAPELQPNHVYKVVQGMVFVYKQRFSSSKEWHAKDAFKKGLDTLSPKDINLFMVVSPTRFIGTHPTTLEIQVYQVEICSLLTGSHGHAIVFENDDLFLELTEEGEQNNFSIVKV